MAFAPKKPVPSQNAMLPQAANYLMAPGDRGGDATRGAQGGADGAPDLGGEQPEDDGGAAGMVPPELQQQMQQLMSQYGTQLLQQALDDCDQDYGDQAAAPDTDSATDLPPVSTR